MRIIVLGGAGDMGNEGVRALIRIPDVTEIMVADINLAAAQKLAAELGEGRVKACRADAFDHAGLVNTLRGYDAAVSFIGPFIYFERRCAQAAIEAGVHYVSIADDFEAAQEVLELHDAAQAAGVTVLTGLGNCPGLTNLLARRGIEALPEGTADRVNISWFGGADDAEGYANFQHAVHIFAGRVVSFENGQTVWVRAGGGKEVVDFGPPSGPLPCYYTGHAEPVVIPRAYPQLKEVTLKGAIWPTWLATLGVFLGRTGVIGGKRMQKFWADFFYRLLPLLGKGNKTVSGFRVDVHGQKDGQNAHVWYVGVDRMKRITAIPAVLGAVQIARGTITRRGVYGPESLIEPIPFFDELERDWNIQIKSQGPNPKAQVPDRGADA
jgi:saccharopine dehydrogenase-like NADP-dependent oxidoreductase